MQKTSAKLIIIVYCFFITGEIGELLKTQSLKNENP